uniref:Ribulose bisphosphate carboxylase/oxygenase activase AAA helical domain-containing protein n=1 Tax=Oryza glumipatula TaxID=40148 RepID=A0A0D9ZRV2_9ORYZ
MATATATSLASSAAHRRLPPSRSAASSILRAPNRGRLCPGSPSVLRASSSSPSSPQPTAGGDEGEEEEEGRRLSKQSSWEAKDSEGDDYLYRLGKEADNMNIAVGARSGIVDDLFVGNFLGKDSDIVFDYRQKATRTFEYLQGDYYIAPLFLDKVGIWGGKGQGKTFQTELIFRAMGVEPVIMSAGELESEKAGEPGRLIRDRYRTASQVIQNQPDREDIINIVHRMYIKDGLSFEDVSKIVDTFPNQERTQPTAALDFYGALRSRTYDRAILQWVEEIGGHEQLNEKLLKRKKGEELPAFIPPKTTVDALIESGDSLVKEQELIMNSKLSKEYMKNLDD